MAKTKTLYFGAGWFNEKQNKAYQEAMAALKQNPTVDLENSYVPLDNQYKGIRVMNIPNTCTILNGLQLLTIMTWLALSLPISCSAFICPKKKMWGLAWNLVMPYQRANISCSSFLTKIMANQST